MLNAVVAFHSNEIQKFEELTNARIILLCVLSVIERMFCHLRSENCLCYSFID